MHAWSSLNGFLLRVVQSAVWSAPYLLAGLLIAALLRSMLGPAAIRRLVGEGRWSGPPRAWLLGILTPVSALGALPILIELARARVRPGSLAAFALSASVFHPLSLAYAAASLGPAALGTLLGASALFAIAVGLLVALIAPGETILDGSGDEPTPGYERGDRLKAAALDIATKLTGPLAIDLAVGLLGAGLLGATLSPDYLPPRLSARDPLAVPAAAVMAVPALILPEKAVMGVIEMRKLGMATGAMFVLLALGAGVGLGHLCWATRTYGARRALGLTALSIASAIAIGYAVNGVMAPTGAEDLDTHAFDDYANPYYFHAPSGPSLAGHYKKVFTNALPGWPLAVGVLAALATAGVWLRAKRPEWTFEALAARSTPPEPAATGEPIPIRTLPPFVKPLTAGVAALALGVAALYSYYPSPSQLFPDLYVTYADLYSSLQVDPPATVLTHVDMLDRLAAKITPGARIRGVPTDPDAPQKAAAFRRELERLRQAVTAGRREEAKAIGQALRPLYQDCRGAFLAAR